MIGMKKDNFKDKPNPINQPKLKKKPNWLLFLLLKQLKPRFGTKPLLTKKKPTGFFFYSSSWALLASFLSLNISRRLPINQYGTTKVNKKIINQKPMVKMVKNAKNPKYWSNSNIFLPLVVTKILSSSVKKQILFEKSVFLHVDYQIIPLRVTFVKLKFTSWISE
jgi:hypothetical protein